MNLLLGNKNYSSWSMRAGVVVLAFDLPVEFTMIWLDEDDALATKRQHSPAGRVPILEDGDLTLWDSLAICEYFAEKFPDRDLWPADPTRRARARSLAAEMHSGFAALRRDLPVNLRAVKDPRSFSADVEADIARTVEIFASADRPYLCGEFSIADAFFAPVATRFRTYQIELSGAAAAYRDAVLCHPGVRKWIDIAGEETRHMPDYD